MSVSAPTLTTERLILRMPRLDDFEPRTAHQTSARSHYEGGPWDRRTCWRLFASEVALWPLRGYGPFSITDRTSGTYLGEAGIYRPEGYPEPEIGWFVTPEAEGRGIAHEAARAVLGWARETFGWTRLVSYITPGNDRSVALGLRLGGVIDPELPSAEPGDIVIRHDLKEAA